MQHSISMSLSVRLNGNHQNITNSVDVEVGLAEWAWAMQNYAFLINQQIFLFMVDKN
jgi:hypothetical protein